MCINGPIKRGNYDLDLIKNATNDTKKNVSINRPLLVAGEESSKTNEVKQKKMLDTNLDLFDGFKIILLLLVRVFVDGG